MTTYAESAGVERFVLAVHDHRAVAATLFRRVKSFIGELNQSLDSPFRQRLDAGRSDAKGHLPTLAKRRMSDVETSEIGVQLAAQFFDPIAANVIQKDRKLLTTVARSQIQRTT